MRQHDLDVLKKFEPFTALLEAGATPSQIKKVVLALLDPYIVDKDLLRQLAISVLANETVCVGQLSSRLDWMALLYAAFLIRERAISVDKARSFEVFCFFKESIREAQRKYSLQIVFEQSKDDLHIDE